MLQVETILHHLLSTVGRMFRRVAVSFAGVFLFVAAVVEAIGAVLTGSFPGTGLTHVVAVIIGFSLALNVGLVVAIEEGLQGFIHLIQDIVKVTEAAAKKAEQFVEHEGEQLIQGAGRAVQGIEHGASTVVRDVARLPGQVVTGVEGGVQGIERRITGNGGDQRSS